MSFQSLFARAVRDPAATLPPPWAALPAHPAFAVYRNTVACACIDALEANFPAVARLVGREWFRSAAALYARAHPPRTAWLHAYGDEDFGVFVQSLPSAAPLPWLADVASLDGAFRASEGAEGAAALPADGLGAMPPERLAAQRLAPHPTARWAWFEAHPAASIWRRNHPATAGSAPAEWDWQAEGLLLTRPQLKVQCTRVSRSACLLLDGCAQGLPLGAAAERVLSLRAQANDLPAALATLLAAGAFRSPQPGDPT
ncbi:DNA-binding domain-containing protein [Ramlibacter rhizophilus]|uniref:DUF2063 domain-containing protein n=1 Tax=Ramlibacter rhizophilus TaxID=1781167 RepID=A0A4Z0BVD2_9BURK|nr:DNA-binding domain-containing protein [Ramlibacter rhizophilus]TFZ03276.1 DUF2063 domain-containing protein [Ramlibacter rhizophilus]